ncbi:MAG: protein kinase [Planctomycetes bacterium]|nr:protein kinase [Planctomycetota bacterium]
MADNPSREARTVTLSTELLSEQIGLAFKKAWQAGLKPRIEDWLDKATEKERPTLFRMLAKCEKELRTDGDVIADLRRRFPDYHEPIDALSRDGTDFELTPAGPMPMPKIPGYQIIERIAVGGMGVVYKALQRGLERIVALKMVRGGRWVQEDELTRFKAEAQAIAGIEHPHIVRIHDFGEFEGLPYFTMEYVDGGSLSQKIADKSMTFREIAELLEQLARTMQVVHDQNIIHRDLKHGNILLMKDGTPKISDFGLAKRLGTDLNMTVSGMVMGTVNYMAPEQARGDRLIGGAADIYALGALLYECLTHQPPFQDDTYERTIRRVLDEEPTRPRDVNGSIPSELETIALKCLAKEPSERYAKADDLAEDLRRYLQGEPLSIGAYDVVDQHSRWARKLGLDIIDLLACTQSAFVYKARETIINRQVILKISTGPVGSPAHARLHRQAEAMAELVHPNIEQLHVYGEQGGQPYLVQEFVDGRSFSTIMRERVLDPEESATRDGGEISGEFKITSSPRDIFTPVTSALAAEWTLILARALQFVHEQGVLHGAIYPGEIRLTENGTVQLCGFGAAQKVPVGEAPLEASATWVRPNYQPPEQLRQDWSALCPASDVYSLGAVFYELLTGQVPFFGLDVTQTREIACKELPVAPRNLNDRIPSALDWLCQRCLAKKPEDRFTSAADMADALERYLRSLESTGDETRTIEPIRDPIAAGGDFELRIFHKGSRKPIHFPLPRRWVAVGRAPDSDLVIPDEFCSRNHCAIFWDDRSNQHVLILIKAKHGVKINGELVRGSQALIPGDTIQIASARFVFDRKRGETITPG